MTLRYHAIVADPPWALGDSLPGGTRGAAKHYPVMTAAAICALADSSFDGLHIFDLPIADDAILWLWRLSSMQREALDVAEAWGFRVVTEIVWNKLTKTGLPWFGMGRSYRGAHETALVCARGKYLELVQSHSLRTTFEAKLPVDENGKAIHSAKPDEFFVERVEPLIGGAGPGCVEFFARRRRAGWEAVGNQLPAVVHQAAALAG